MAPSTAADLASAGSGSNARRQAMADRYVRRLTHLVTRSDRSLRAEIFGWVVLLLLASAVIEWQLFTDALTTILPDASDVVARVMSAGVLVLYVLLFHHLGNAVAEARRTSLTMTESQHSPRAFLGWSGWLTLAGGTGFILAVAWRRAVAVAADANDHLAAASSEQIGQVTPAALASTDVLEDFVITVAFMGLVAGVCVFTAVLRTHILSEAREIRHARENADRLQESARQAAVVAGQAATDLKVRTATIHDRRLQAQRLQASLTHRFDRARDRVRAAVAAAQARPEGTSLLLPETHTESAPAYSGPVTDPTARD
ncbi:hypothetical protein [Dietzia sp. SYD-A1]|uniref:hypothetical protein n=1 Tax=Dietzia sp. SYD-A1 TaxID=2780141 RepID=UPI00189199BC|nr:hypothetical protein [Dietzia sp. SYD-A1]